jgi:hypothetical protein
MLVPRMIPHFATSTCYRNDNSQGGISDGSQLDAIGGQDLLFREAALLDGWRLTEWADLFTEDGEYLVPSTDLPDAHPSASLYLVYDDRHHLQERAKRQLKSCGVPPLARPADYRQRRDRAWGERHRACGMQLVVDRSRLGKNDVSAAQ